MSYLLLRWEDNTYARGEVDVDLGLFGITAAAVSAVGGEIDIDLGVFELEIDADVAVSGEVDVDLGVFEIEAEGSDETIAMMDVGIGVTAYGSGYVHEDLIVAKIFPYNRWSDSNLGTISGSSGPSSFPASNTQLQQRSKVWRSNSADIGAAYLTRDFGSGQLINSVCLVGLNLSRVGQIRIRVGNDPTFVSNNYDSGFVNSWPPFLDGDTAEDFGHEGTAYPSDMVLDLLRFCHETIRNVRTFEFGMSTSRYVRLDFQDLENSDGFVEVGWVYAGIAIEITEGIAYDFDWQIKSMQGEDRAYSGRIWMDIYYRQIVANAKINTYDAKRAFGFWQFVFDMLGVSEEFVITFRNDSVKENFWMTIYCHFSDIPKLVQKDGEIFETGIVFEELV